ncbi:MAG: 7-cyano-7-deazaguanine synthase [Syntrophomonadaceae bacterium]|nr:7-cyano-7-deazaguanine synthase [Bacillota bacterium]
MPVKREVKKALVALSGGMDSTTVFVWLLNHGYDVLPVSFQYGAKHNKYEGEAVKKIIEHYKIANHKTINLAPIFSFFQSDLLLSGGEIPEGHYTAPSMKKTVVPARNIIFLSILAGLAWSTGATKIGIGIHQGDHPIYEDCRKEFFKAMDTAIYFGTGLKVELIAPFLETDKQGILDYGLAHNVPYHLTRTCYKDQEDACGKCGSCQERREAFWFSGVEDSIPYEGRKNENG